MNTESIIQLIQKLQAKAENSATTEAEAQAFSEKVQQLLTQHNLDLASVLNLSDDQEKANIVETEIYGGAYTYPWRGYLALEVAKLYFCYLYNQIDPPKLGKYKNTRKMVFVGKVHNRRIAISMYEYLDRTIISLARNYSPFREDQNAFARGCGLRLSQRILEKRTKLQEFIPNQDKSVPALYRSEEQDIKNFMKKISLNFQKTKFDLNSDAAYAGYNAAQTISLNEPQPHLPKFSSHLLGK